jgi:hypothetical protein
LASCASSIVTPKPLSRSRSTTAPTNPVSARRNATAGSVSGSFRAKRQLAADAWQTGSVGRRVGSQRSARSSRVDEVVRPL